MTNRASSSELCVFTSESITGAINFLPNHHRCFLLPANLKRRRAVAPVLSLELPMGWEGSSEILWGSKCGSLSCCTIQSDLWFAFCFPAHKEESRNGVCVGVGGGERTRAEEQLSLPPPLQSCHPGRQGTEQTRLVVPLESSPSGPRGLKMEVEGDIQILAPGED